MVTTTAAKINVGGHVFIVGFLLIITGVVLWLTINFIIDPYNAGWPDTHTHFWYMIIGVFISCILVIVTIWYCMSLYYSVQEYYESKDNRGLKENWDPNNDYP